MHIGILTAGHPPPAMAERLGTYPQMFARLLEGEGFRFSDWSVVDGVFPDSPAAADGWLITGSRHGVYDDLPWIPRLLDFIRETVAAGRPMVGVCFGHQAMAKALGGRVEKFGGGWALGRTRYDWQGGDVHLNAWHQDQVIQPPPGATTVAANDFCAHAALDYGPGLFSVQAHPEYTDAAIAGLIEARRGVVPADRVAVAEDQMGQPLDTARVARQLAAVLKGEAAHG